MELADAAATEALGARLAESLPARGSVHLVGDLGAGKTTLVRGLLRAAGHDGPVRSPTYTLVEPYAIGSGARVFHLDLYRLGDPEELEYIGLRELTAEGLLLVEWPERGEGVLPAPLLSVRLEPMAGGRRAMLTAAGGAPGPWRALAG
ncbi:tRNA (adenosine(37)-N6)-threonylcarbamoyltransferase complex ATPase subunit type 1 TsaE [Spiribacter halobius]|nr:tRNA (adenosine(37)-N6)-threonylcarbamoyltransferase complex ATPase subunit type 1 TsaE [Spiribacter halobius]UEX79907.1 tRNA (adenosine(37)-N6)-threonylcarbamoyltransferase complex ATPase subunit type 1 TsaE [Spiribacter halobius]